MKNYLWPSDLIKILIVSLTFAMCIPTTNILAASLSSLDGTWEYKRGKKESSSLPLSIEVVINGTSWSSTQTIDMVCDGTRFMKLWGVDVCSATDAELLAVEYTVIKRDGNLIVLRAPTKYATFSITDTHIEWIWKETGNIGTRLFSRTENTFTIREEEASSDDLGRRYVRKQ